MNPTRRTVLHSGAGIVTGIALAGCSTLDPARSSGARDASTRVENYSAQGPVVIDGRRVRTIDVHAHC